MFIFYSVWQVLSATFVEADHRIINVSSLLENWTVVLHALTQL